LKHRPSSVLALAVIVGGIAVDGLTAAPLPWLDLLAGTALALSGARVAALGRRLTGLLLVVGAATWFAGTAVPELAYVHRAVLVLVVLSGHGAGPGDLRSRLACLVAVIGTLPWERQALPATATAALVIVARPRSVPAVGLAIAVGWVPFASSVLDIPHAVLLAVYDALVATVGALVVVTAIRSRDDIPDAVVDLATEAGLAAIERVLGEALGTGVVRIGLIGPDGGFQGDDGEQVTVPAGAEATIIAGGGGPLAVVIHPAGALADRRLREAVGAGIRLIADHAALQAALEVQALEIGESRRRLLDAGDRQRASLARRLEEGPLRLLDQLGATITDVPRAAMLLEVAREELDRLGHGLLPRALTRGDLASAIVELRAGAPVPVRVAVEDADLPLAVLVTAYFVVAEALANAVRHARPASVAVSVAIVGDLAHVTIADDGCGGADPAGSGLRGLADRVEAIGGQLIVRSDTSGTTVVAKLPIAPVE
jgi:hypothetical protein